MPIAMSNYANRQSPNQQAKIASMLNAAAQSQRPDQDMPPMRDIIAGMANPSMSPMGPAPPDQRPSSIGPYTGDRPTRRSYRDFSNIPPVPPDIRSAPPPIMDQSGRPDQRLIGEIRQYDAPSGMLDPIRQAPRPVRELEPMIQGPPISQSLGRMQQAPPTIRDQGLRPDPSFGVPDTEPVPEEPSTEPAKRRRKVAGADDTPDPVRRGEPYYAPAPGRVVPSSGGGPRAPEPNREPYYMTAPGMVTLGDMGGGGTGRGFDPRVPAGPGYKTSSHLTSEEWDILRRTGYHEADGMLYSLGPDGVLFYAGNAPNREWRGEPYYGSGAGRVVPGSG